MAGTGDVWLGVDVGTSALKVVGLDESGAVTVSAERVLTVDVPAPGLAEADPEDWHAAVTDAVDEVVGPGTRVRGVGCTGQMHGTVLVGADGEAVGPAVLWPDRRAAGALDRWRALPPDVLTRLANPLAPGMTGPVLTWMCAERPELVRRAARVALPKDVLRARWTGDACTDASDASATLLWELADGGWLGAAVALAGIEASMLPEVVPSDHLLAAGGDGGSLADVPVAVGGADTACSLLAVRRGIGGSWPGGSVVLNLGTGVQAIAPVVDRGGTGRTGVQHHADTGGGAYAMVAAQNGGLAVVWAASALGVAVPDLVRLAEGAAVGAGGVTFVPWLTGERGALAGAHASAAWTGLGPVTTKAELARSVLEAQAFVVRLSVQLLDQPCTAAQLVGGGARSAFVRQLLADVLRVPLTYLRLPSAAAVGAAALVGGVTRGPESLVVGTEVVEPRPDPALDDAYERWVERARRDVSAD